MRRSELNDLEAFAAVASEGSFTRAAAKLGMTQPALSQSMKMLEERLGIRLLARTTRSVATTEAGQRLLLTLKPALDEISQSLAALGEMKDKPSGRIRITAGKFAAIAVLWPRLSRFGVDYPDVEIELTVDEGFTDIVAGHYDAGVRLGEELAQDMIAVRIGPDIRSAVVASPEYLDQHGTPNTPHDLARHNCINYRQSTSGGIYSWEFAEAGKPVRVRVKGSLVFNDIDLMLAAALHGHGLISVFEGQVQECLASGRLIRVLDEFCPSYPGFFLYYSTRRQTPPALAALIDVLRYRDQA